jgi:hypothetical protein
MAVFRVNKTENYTVMSNQHLRDKNLSFKAKGLLSMMLSLPDDWDYSLQGLVAISKENETAVKSTLAELKEYGYLEVIKKFPDSTDTGRIEYEYLVYEKSKQEGEKQGLEILPLEIQPLENQVQLNTNILNTKKQNTKRERPTLEEIQDYIIEKELNVDAKKFFDYFETGNWIDSKGNKVKNWKQKLLTWNNHIKQEVSNKFHDGDIVIDNARYYDNFE